MPLSAEIDDSGLRAAAARLNGAPSRIEQRINGRTIRAMRELLRVVRAVVHVQSGNLRDSLVVEGPFQLGVGTLEGVVRSGVPYAGAEAARGGEHDYPERTLEEGASVLDALARDLELIVIEETGAGRG